MATTDSDAKVRENVLDKLRHDIRIDASNIAVSVHDGVVYLNGTVPSCFQKMIAGQDAQNSTGVLDVVNSLVVTVPLPPTDEEIAATVRGNLDRDVRIPHPERIHVTVRNGVVTLAGTVSTYSQRQDAEEDTRTVSGVVDVVDQISIVPTFARTDAEIAADVRHALDADPDLNAAQIEVNVVNGTVHLRGTVPAYSQISKASDDAWRVPGVVKVVNALTVLAEWPSLSSANRPGEGSSNAGGETVEGALTWLGLVKLPNLLSLLMGGWEMLAPFALGYADLTVPTTSDIVVGFLVVLCAAIRLFKVERTAWLSWVIAALGLWLVLAPFVLGYVTIPGPATNDVGIGTFTFVFGIWGALATAPLRTE
jgi:osmotically-inducible protein OsmY